MGWVKRGALMLWIVIIYFCLIRPTVGDMAHGWIRSISDLMVGLGILLFGIGFYLSMVRLNKQCDKEQEEGE